MSDQMNPKYSIIIPVYNVEKYLAYCLDSVMEQTFDDYEIILVNDGSTDKSLSICNDYIASHKNKRIVLINQQNKGLLAARRAGIKASRGRYIMHVDSDDAIRADALQTIDQLFAKYNADMIMFEYSFHQNFYPIRKDPSFDRSQFFDSTKKGELITSYCRGTLSNMVAKVVRRECALVDKDYSDYMMLNSFEDQLQVLDILNQISNAYYIKEPLYWYRQTNSNSITGTFQMRDFTEISKVSQRQLDAAISWEATFGITGLEDLILTKLLKNVFYSARRKIRWNNHIQLFNAIRDIPQLDKAYNKIDEVRVDIKLFYKLVHVNADTFAYILCKIHYLAAWLNIAAHAQSLSSSK